MLMYALETARRWDDDFTDGDFGVRLVDPEQAAAFSTRLLSIAEGAVVVENLYASFVEDAADVRSQIRRVLVPLSAFLLLLVAVNLMAGLMMSVRERRREIGVLKAVGLTPGQITASILSGAVVLSIIGSLIGAPAGWAFMRLLPG
ncbi:MAG TPA: FtsX-like permease family protein [Dehalococcoidia bacterium]|jgi:putative ABC transport system permease protein|nr:FtsX-like permease family protein [Dehalococcoidia bacterium]